MSTPGVKISYQEHAADAPLPLSLHAIPRIVRPGKVLIRRPD